jgi:NAD/NADP transhydrogenase alpha subunit
MSAWVALLGAVGAGSIATAIIGGLFVRRRVTAEASKLGADATEIIQKAASGVVLDIERTLARKTAEMVEMRREHRAELARMIADHAEEMDTVRTVLSLHIAWDAIAIQELAKLGVDLPPAPPLLPVKP